MRRPLAIGLAFLVLVGLAACGGGDGDDAAAPETATAPADTATAPADTAVESVPELTTCSATDHGLTLSKQELPPPVAEVRERIFAAVSDCDFAELEKIALEKGDDFNFSFDATQDSPAAYWRQVEQNAADSPMFVLALILTMPVTRTDAGYAWPSAAGPKPTEADWQALLDNVLYTQQEVQTMRAGGTGYTGWRTTITPDGDWQFFVEGD
jgi:hypothetical protein